MITFMCSKCGLLSKESVYLIDKKAENIVSINCKQCNSEVFPPIDSLYSAEYVEELDKVIYELSYELHQKEILDSLQSLVAAGDVGFAGINEKGEEYYELTEQGRTRQKKIKDM